MSRRKFGPSNRRSGKFHSITGNDWENISRSIEQPLAINWLFFTQESDSISIIRNLKQPFHNWKMNLTFRHSWKTYENYF